MTLSDTSALLDVVNHRLLRELHAEPRITMSALARRIGMPALAVTERVQRMERGGVITGYRMEVNPAAPESTGTTSGATVRAARAKAADLRRKHSAHDHGLGRCRSR